MVSPEAGMAYPTTYSWGSSSGNVESETMEIWGDHPQGASEALSDGNITFWQARVGGALASILPASSHFLICSVKGRGSLHPSPH